MFEPPTFHCLHKESHKVLIDCSGPEITTTMTGRKVQHDFTLALLHYYVILGKVCVQTFINLASWETYAFP